MAFYATYLTNKYGIKLKKAKTLQEQIDLRLEYSEILAKKLNLTIQIACIGKDLIYPKLIIQETIIYINHNLY